MQEYDSSINARTSKYEIGKKVGKMSRKFSPTPTPVVRAADGTIVRDHKEVTNIMIGTFASASEDGNYPAEFLQHKQRVEMQQLGFN